MHLSWLGCNQYSHLIWTVITVVSFQVLGRCFLTVMQVHFQFLSQALQKVQPVAQSCLAEALAQAQERCANARSQSSDLGPLTELEEASRSWKGAAEVCSHGPRTLPGLGLRNMGFDCVRWNQLVSHSWEIPAIYDFQPQFPISSLLGFRLSVNLTCCDSRRAVGWATDKTRVSCRPTVWSYFFFYTQEKKKIT